MSADQIDCSFAIEPSQAGVDKKAKAFLAREGREERVLSLLQHHAAQLSKSIADIEEILRRSEATVKFVGSGCDHCVFRLQAPSGSWGVRFPKRSESAAWLRREHRLFASLTERLVASGLDVRVPAHLQCFAPSSDFPLPWVIYELLEGTQGHHILLPGAIDGLAGRLASALGVLHGTPVDAELQEKAEGHDDWQPDSYREVIRQDLNELAEAPNEHLAKDPTALLLHMGLPEQLARLAGSFFDEKEYPAPPSVEPRYRCLVHGDLDPEHYFLNPSLVGIIDWSDARVADPARDLAAVLSWGGIDFFVEFLAAYPRKAQLDCAHIAKRLVFLARGCTIDGWFSTVEDGGAVHASALQMLYHVFGLNAGNPSSPARDLELLIEQALQ